jgi:hypothetical protein
MSAMCQKRTLARSMIPGTVTYSALKFPMEAKWYDVRRKRTSNLFKALCVKHQQKGSAAPAVEDHGEDHAFKMIRITGSRNEHRLPA